MYGQALLVDTQFPVERARLGVPNGFIGDHFQVGSRGDVWVVDSLSTWVATDETAARPGDLFESVKLFGGIEAELPPPGAPPQPDCACHNLVVLKGGAIRSGEDAPGLRISAAAPDLWRIDFRDLRWSVPGGVPIQFGVLATGRRHTWFNTASRTAAAHDLRLFDENGKLLGRYPAKGAPLDAALGIPVQVRGHRTVPVAVRSSGGMLEVTLQAGNGFEPGQANITNLRLGARRAPPAHVAAANHGLVLQFRRDEVAIRPGELTVCLTGTLVDGIPFEGCDLLPKP